MNQTWRNEIKKIYAEKERINQLPIQQIYAYRSPEEWLKEHQTKTDQKIECITRTPNNHIYSILRNDIRTFAIVQKYGIKDAWTVTFVSITDVRIMEDAIPPWEA